MAGTYSLTSVTATGNCAPSPTPTKKRNTNSQPKSGATAHKAVAMLYTIKLTANTVLRPILSAVRPPITAPMAMPTKPMLTTQPNSFGLRPHSLPSVANTNDTMPVSIASNSQPKPTSTKSL